MELQVGAILEGKVTGCAKFGAFVFLPSVGKSGMVHISEVANTYVNDINEHLKEGQSVKVKVLSVDPSGKIALSIKKAVEATPKPRPVREETYYKPRTLGADASFEDKLKQFLADSESSASAIKHHAQRKSSSYRRGR